MKISFGILAFNHWLVQDNYPPFTLPHPLANGDSWVFGIVPIYTSPPPQLAKETILKSIFRSLLCVGHSLSDAIKLGA
jgi:hypothetical protein